MTRYAIRLIADPNTNESGEFRCNAESFDEADKRALEVFGPQTEILTTREVVGDDQ